MVRFTLDRTGRLMSRRVERSSGNAELDSLALELLGRAAPLPPPPPEMPGAVVELVVPVRYTVR
jgi:protein TonB